MDCQVQEIIFSDVYFLNHPKFSYRDNLFGYFLYYALADTEGSSLPVQRGKITVF